MIRATLYMQVKEGREAEFERAWQNVAQQARRIPGNLRQTLLRDPDSPSAFLITTEWESREAYKSFEVSPEQDDLTAPLRALRESARQVVYDVVADVEHGDVDRGSSESPRPDKGRVVFTIRLKPGMQQQFLEAYESIRYEVAQGVPGHLVDQVCQAPDDPDLWLITSEWESLDDFLAWEATQEHRDLAKPMRDCIAEARSLKYVVREETSAALDVMGRAASGAGR
jgi:heme oxygenase (mycobilin-producing)